VPPRPPGNDIGSNNNCNKNNNHRNNGNGSKNNNNGGGRGSNSISTNTDNKGTPPWPMFVNLWQWNIAMYTGPVPASQQHLQAFMVAPDHYESCLEGGG
jgi:hypothetical protein